MDDAIAALVKHGDDAKILAGGHSLIPAMKLRLAVPKVIVDIGRADGLAGIREVGGRIAIGAMTTHHEIEASTLLAARCPLMPQTASHIGDQQVRNRGTIGGSLAHADPAADWPAAILALDAEIEVAGPQGRRTVRAAGFFVDLLETALAPNEILCEIRVPFDGPVGRLREDRAEGQRLCARRCRGCHRQQTASASASRASRRKRIARPASSARWPAAR